jgi:quinoprotein glucose dehydrogenase
VRGYDVRTGKQLWTFRTIPRPGEFGNETWEKDSWAYSGHTNVWNTMSGDEELGHVYLPLTTPTNDWYGGHRPGSNLFAESIVALDVKTGKRIWHFQGVHHGIWDYDFPCPPILADITVKGRRIKALAQPSKQAMLYVFDRTNGQPIWPIEERPVPRGDVPGEWYSPTQPFVTKPPAFERQGVSVDDLIDFTPELRAEAIKIASRYKMGPLFTPPLVSRWEGPLGILMLPAITGGANWQGGALDPETNMFYIFSNTSISTLGLVPADPARSDFGYVQGTARPPAPAGAAPSDGAAAAGGDAAGGRGGAAAAAGRGGAPGAGRGAAGGRGAAAAAGGGAEGGGGGGTNVQGLPLVKPPYGRITALNLNRGDMAWQIAHGDTPDNIKNHPALKGLNIPRTGRQGRIGVLVTKTLVIAGEGGFATTPNGRGAMLRAYDKASGNEVGAVFMSAPQTGSPMTYLHDGRQYITVSISGPGSSGELVAYRLPQSR